MRVHKRDQTNSGRGSRPVRLIGLQTDFSPSYRGASLALVLAMYSLAGANAQPAQNDAPTSTDWSKAQSVEIVMTNFSFMPKALQLRRNTPYRLHFVNNGSSNHSFDAPELFRAMITAPDDRAKVEDGTIEVDEGKTVDVMVMPLKPGSYAFHCSHFLHTTFGMRGEATIQ
jgi:uncharacterized cupredoxin-like copper-binding protein